MLAVLVVIETSDIIFAVVEIGVAVSVGVIVVVMGSAIAASLLRDHKTA